MQMVGDRMLMLHLHQNLLMAFSGVKSRWEKSGYEHLTYLDVEDLVDLVPLFVFLGSLSFLSLLRRFLLSSQLWSGFNGHFTSIDVNHDMIDISERTH
jgi:hypothetical protein